MVTCSELSTIVTTSDNSFLIWGSRPLIRSPLIEYLVPPEPPHVSTATDRDEVFNDSSITPTPAVVQNPLSPISIEFTSSNISTSTGRLASSESTPEKKGLSSEDVAAKPFEMRTASSENIAATRLGHKSSSSDSMNRLSSRLSAEYLDKRSSVSLLEVPRVQIPCMDSASYLQKLMSTLQEILDASRTSKGAKRDSVSSGRGLKRGPSSSSSSVEIGSSDGIIMKPTALDLVGKLGILSSFSAQGLRNAKLECMCCYGGNVVVVIEAMEAGLSKEGAEPHRSVQPFLKLGRKLTDKR